MISPIPPTELAAALAAKLSPAELDALCSYMLPTGGATIVHTALVRALDRVRSK